MNNRGITITSLIITVIVMIIIAAVTIMNSTSSLEEANKVKFQNDLKSVVDALDVYNERAMIRGVANYDRENLNWNGISEKAENTAKIKDPSHIEEDSIRDILDGNNLPKTLEGIITIKNGEVKVNEKIKPQYDWAVELYGENI